MRRDGTMVWHALLAGVGLLAAPLAGEGERATQGPCRGELFRAVDFLLGEWEIFDQRGVKTGGSSTALDQEGCLVVERWQRVDGERGLTYSFVDRALGSWRRISVGPRSTVDLRGAPGGRGGVVFEVGGSRSHEAPARRWRWAPGADGTVVSTVEERDRRSGAWSARATETYRPVAAEPSSAGPPARGPAPVSASSLERCDGHDHGAGRLTWSAARVAAATAEPGGRTPGHR